MSWPKRAEAEAAARDFAAQAKESKKGRRSAGAKSEEVQEERIAEAQARQLMYQGVQY
jgi:hypothetical protein